MRLALAAALKDLRVRIRDPLGFAVWIGIPLAIGGLMWLAGGAGSGPKPHSPLYVDDRDDTFLSGALGEAYGRMNDVFEVHALDEAHARARLNDDDGSALIVIPEGFQDAFLRNRPATLQLVTNPAQRILPGIVREPLEALPDTSFYLQSIAGDEVAEMFDDFGEDVKPTDAQVIARSLSLKHAIDAIADYVFPPVIQLEVKGSEAKAEAGFDFGRTFFPSLIFMTLLFLAQGLAEDLWKEKSQGALRRMASSPAGFAALLLGKLGAALAVGAIVLAVALAFGWTLFGLAPLRIPLAFLWTVGACGMLYVGFALVQVLTSSERAASIVGNLLLFPLMMIGGSFFPFESMPEWMQSIGRWTPNGWALVHLKGVLSGSEGLLELARAGLVLVAATALGFALTARRLAGGFLRS